MQQQLGPLASLLSSFIGSSFRTGFGLDFRCFGLALGTGLIGSISSSFSSSLLESM
jgi:hypothetical protein